MAFLDEIGLLYYDTKIKEYITQKVSNAVGNITSFRFEIVTELPQTGEVGVVYLKALAELASSNLYEEFFWTGDSFEFIGTNSFNIDDIELVTGIIYNEEKDSIAEGIKESLGALNSALGDRSHAEGGPYQTGAAGSIAQGRASHAEGATTKAVADAAHTEGILTVAGREVTALQQAATDLGISGTIEEIATKLLGYGAHAEGSLSQALGSSSHAEGDKTLALANATHSEGSETVAFGEASHAEGFKTRAEGNSSHAEGRMTLATGNSSHAEGNETEASGAYSHAEGSNTTAEKRDSHAEGAYTKAAGIASHAEGEHTSTSNTAEHAEGAYNYTHTGDTDSKRTMSSIGIGNEISKKNAFEVMKNGDVYVYGVGGYDGTNVTSPNTSGITGQPLQKYLSSQQLPQVENEILYFNEQEGFVSQQLLLLDGVLIVNDLNDFDLCTKADDVEKDVLGAWQQFTDSDSFSPEYGKGAYISDSGLLGYGRWYSSDNEILNTVNSIDFNGYMMPFSKQSYTIESIFGTKTGNTTGDNIGFSIVNDKTATAKHIKTKEGRIYYRNTLYDIYTVAATESTPQRPVKSAWVCENEVTNTAYVIYMDSPERGNEATPAVGSTYLVYFIDSIKTNAGRRKYTEADLTPENKESSETIESFTDASGVIDFIIVTVTNSSSMEMGHSTSGSNTGTIYVYGSRYNISTNSWTNELVFDGNANGLGRLLVDYIDSLNTNSNVSCIIKTSVDFNQNVLTVQFSDATPYIDTESLENAVYNGSELKINFTTKKYYILPRADYDDRAVIEKDLPITNVNTEFWDGFCGKTKFMYHAYSYQNLYTKCLNIMLDNKVVWILNDGTNIEYGLNALRDSYEIKNTSLPTKQVLTGSRLAYNPITKKTFYSDGDKIIQIAALNEDHSNDSAIETPSTQNTLPEITVSLDIEVEGGETSVEIDTETLDAFTSIVREYLDLLPKLVTVDITKTIFGTTTTILSYTTLGTLKITTGPGEVSGGEGIHWNVVICTGDLIFTQKGESLDQDGKIFWTQGMEYDTLLPTKTSSLS